MTTDKLAKSVDDLLPLKAMDALQELHRRQLHKLTKQRLAPIPLILDHQFSDKLPYSDIPIAIPWAVGQNPEVTVESRMRSILSAVNTITAATAALVEEGTNSGKDEIKELHQKFLQEKLLKDALQIQNDNLIQQLTREQELVKHSKEAATKYKDRCKALHQEHQQALLEIKGLKGARKAYKKTPH